MNATDDPLDVLRDASSLEVAPLGNASSVRTASHVILLPPHASMFLLCEPASDALPFSERAALLSFLEAQRDTRASRLLHALLVTVDTSQYPLPPAIVRSVLLSLLKAWAYNRPRADRAAIVRALVSLAPVLPDAPALRHLLKRLDDAMERETRAPVPQETADYFAAVAPRTTPAPSTAGHLHLVARLRDATHAPEPVRRAWLSLTAIAPASALLTPDQLDEMATLLADRGEEPVIASIVAVAHALALAECARERSDAIRTILLSTACAVTAIPAGHPALLAHAAALRVLTADTALAAFVAPLGKALRTRSPRTTP
jgi:hypothetical protein